MWLRCLPCTVCPRSLTSVPLHKPRLLTCSFWITGLGFVPDNWILQWHGSGLPEWNQPSPSAKESTHARASPTARNTPPLSTKGVQFPGFSQAGLRAFVMAGSSRQAVAKLGIIFLAMQCAVWILKLRGAVEVGCCARWTWEPWKVAGQLAYGNSALHPFKPRVVGCTWSGKKHHTLWQHQDWVWLWSKSGLIVATSCLTSQEATADAGPSLLSATHTHYTLAANGTNVADSGTSPALSRAGQQLGQGVGGGGRHLFNFLNGAARFWQQQLSVHAMVSLGT